jgi:hypothetical protein
MLTSFIKAAGSSVACQRYLIESLARSERARKSRHLALEDAIEK